jgi:hypothetical protein
MGTTVHAPAGVTSDVASDGAAGVAAAGGCARVAPQPAVRIAAAASSAAP